MAINWPKQDYKSMVAFYGDVGENMTSIKLPYKMRIAWEPNRYVDSMTCHLKCGLTFTKIFEDVLREYGEQKLRVLKLDLFGGCLNVRKMRGGSSWSIHSWGAAVDLAPDENELKWGKDKALFAKPEYERFWKIVESYGAVSLGRQRNYDFMHFQFAKL